MSDSDFDNDNFSKNDNIKFKDNDKLANNSKKEINKDMNKKFHKIKFKQFNNSKTLNEIILFNNFSYISTKENKQIKNNKSYSEKKQNIIKIDNIEIKDTNSSFTSKSFLNEVKNFLGNENLNKSDIEILKKNLNKGLRKNKSVQSSLKKNLCLSLNSNNFYYPFSQKLTIKNRKNGISGGDLSNSINERNKKKLIDKIKKSKNLYFNKNKGNSKKETIQIKKLNYNTSLIKSKKNENKKELNNSILNKKTNNEKGNYKSLFSNQLHKIRKKSLTNKLNNEDEDFSQLRTNSKSGNLKTKTSLLHNSLIREQSEGKKNKKNYKSYSSLMCNDIIKESNEINSSPKKSKNKYGIKLSKKSFHKKLPFINSNNNYKNLILNQNEKKKKNYHFLVSLNKHMFEKKKKNIKMNQGLNFGYEYWKENQLRLNQILKEKINNSKLLNNSISQPLLFNNTNNELDNYNNNLISINRKCKLNETDFFMNINDNSSLNWTDRILGNNFGKTINDNRIFNRRILKFDMIHQKNCDNLNNFSNQNQNQDSIILHYPSIFTYFKE